MALYTAVALGPSKTLKWKPREMAWRVWIPAANSAEGLQREDFLKRIQEGLEDFQKRIHKRCEDIQQRIQELHQYIEMIEMMDCIATVIVILVYIWAAFVILFTCIAVLARFRGKKSGNPGGKPYGKLLPA